MNFPFFQRDPLAKLLTEAQQGDEQAFAGLYDALYPRVWAFVVRRTRTREDAEDVVSRAFHKLVEKLPQIEVDKGALPFVLAVARNLLIDDLRTQRAGLTPGLSTDEAAALLTTQENPLGELLREEELRRLRDELSRLPAEARELIALRYGDGLEHAEIAALLGVPAATVRQRASRALRTLKEALSAPVEANEVAHGP
ncbi:MAG: RNA polymerase sigma factor [Deltaproteobacteria bacterium]|nr:RNA polymerase sigma factor [Deltaproteobacteria bacterium]